MASLQLLKSSPSNFLAKFGCFCLEFNAKSSVRRNLRLQNSGIVFDYRRLRVTCEAGANDDQNKGEEPPESLFMKELKRRGVNSSSLLEEKNRSIDRDDEIKFREEDGSWSYKRKNGVTTDDERSISNQREKSMAINSEGLEGLIPRAKLLLTLGGTFFLAFWPLILATTAFFCALYLYFGPEFVHDGSKTSMVRDRSKTSMDQPPYVDPYELLEEDRKYKTAPLLN